MWSLLALLWPLDFRVPHPGPRAHAILTPDYKRCNRLQKMQQTTKVATDYKRCNRLQKMQPTTKDATDFKKCNRLQKMQPTTKDATDYKRCNRLQKRNRLQKMQPTTKDATDYKRCNRLQKLQPTIRAFSPKNLSSSEQACLSIPGRYRADRADTRSPRSRV